jgi:hypothetical protein
LPFPPLTAHILSITNISKKGISTKYFKEKERLNED